MSFLGTDAVSASEKGTVYVDFIQDIQILLVLEINAFYSILDRRFTNFMIRPGRKRNEYAAFCEMVDDARKCGPPAVYFADMGYASYNSFAHVIENGQFFPIRCNDKRLKGILAGLLKT